MNCLQFLCGEDEGEEGRKKRSGARRKKSLSEDSKALPRYVSCFSLGPSTAAALKGTVSCRAEGESIRPSAGTVINTLVVEKVFLNNPVPSILAFQLQ